jgi:hypothetical protein
LLAIATAHPSAILRAPDAASRQRRMDEFLNDMKRVALLAREAASGMNPTSNGRKQ